MGKLLSRDEAADFLGVTVHRIKQFALEGRVGQKIGGRYVFDLAQLAKFKKLERPTGKRISKPRKTSKKSQK